MAVLETQTLLESVETAISTILTGGQSYQIGSRRYTRADLGELHRMRRTLKAQYENENSGPARNYARFNAPV